MDVEEIRLFLKEMEAVKKLQHYLPMDILSEHICDITIEMTSLSLFVEYPLTAGFIRLSISGSARLIFSGMT